MDPEDRIEDVELEDEVDDTPANDQLNNRIKKLEENDVVQRLMADPDVRSVLEARRAGKAVKVSLVDDESEDDDDEVFDPKLEIDEAEGGEDEASDSKRAQKQILGQLTTLFKQFDEHNKKRYSKLESRLNEVAGFADTVQKKEIKDQIKQVQEKYDDFDEYRDQMAKTAKSTPGLSVEEYYLIAKARSGKLKFTNPSTQTEKPTHQPRRPERQSGKKQKMAQGRKGFNDSLANALEGLDI